MELLALVLKEDYYIKAGDRCIKFLGEDDVEYILQPGIDPRVGTPIVGHPVTGEIVTHGHEVIREGDKVIIVPLDTGDWAALKPAWSQESGCKPIVKWVHETSYIIPEGQPHEYEYWYRSYDIHLSEPFYRNDHDMNINSYFMSYNNDWRYGFLDNRWPYGAVTLGFGYSEDDVNLGTGYYGPSPDVTWYWDRARSPYYSIAGGPTMALHQDQASIDGIQYDDGEHFCHMDALNVNTCNDRFANATNIPGDLPIEYLHVQVRSAGSLYFGGFTKSFMMAIDVCRQVPSDCEVRCYGGRNIYPPIPPYEIMDNPEDWEEYIEEWP